MNKTNRFIDTENKLIIAKEQRLEGGLKESNLKMKTIFK